MEWAGPTTMVWSFRIGRISQLQISLTREGAKPHSKLPNWGTCTVKRSPHGNWLQRPVGSASEEDRWLQETDSYLLRAVHNSLSNSPSLKLQLRGSSSKSISFTKDIPKGQTQLAKEPC